MTDNLAELASLTFATPGIYAIDPKAFGVEQFWEACKNLEPAALIHDGKTALLSVSGPLSYSHPIAATYSRTLARVFAALDTTAEVVVMHIGSPGGDVAGCFDAARAIRAAADAKGKRLIGYVDQQACSSGYALASACHEIVVSSTGSLGSIGVIATIGSLAAAEKASGLRFELVTSGKRKADGNPHAPITDSVIAAYQASVDAMAGEFYRLVAAHRGIKDGGESLEAGTFVGAAAVRVGLADRVASLSECLEGVARARVAPSLSANTESAARAAKATKMPDDEKDEKKDAARKALKAEADGDDPEKAARARKALAAYDEQEEPGDDKDKAKKAAKAEADSVAAFGAVANLETALRESRAHVSALTARLDASERATFLATRPDLSAELVKSLEGVPLERLKEIVAAVPTGKPAKAVVASGETPANPLAVTPVVTPADGEEGNASHLPPEDAFKMRAAFGLEKYEPTVQNTTYQLVLGKLEPVKKV